MAGYSGTPLVEKLGIKPAFRVAFIAAPVEFADALGELPEGAVIVPEDGIYRSALELIVFFTIARAELAARFVTMAKWLKPAGMLWIAWPKKASGVATDLNENIVREIGLKAGLVDTKICAIDEVWSGLKFVIRVKDRPVARGVK
jgi:hypothetical protein